VQVFGACAVIPTVDGTERTRLFREVNECIDELLGRFGAADRAEFLCECPSAGCSRLLTLARCEFERIRGEGAFIIAAGCVAAALSSGTTVRFVVVPELRAVAEAPERPALPGAAARTAAAAWAARRAAGAGTWAESAELPARAGGLARPAGPARRGRAAPPSGPAGLGSPAA
jgi:hypothetical protein